MVGTQSNLERSEIVLIAGKGTYIHTSCDSSVSIGRTWRKSASMLLFMWKKPKNALFRLITMGKISGTGTPDVLQES